jgi:hypothetical protein
MPERRPNMSETIAAIMHSKKTRYDILDDLLLPHIPSRNGKYDEDAPVVDVFIDVHSVYASLWKEDLMDHLSALKKIGFWMLSGELINMVAHWRHWLWSRRGTACNVYLYHASGEAEWASSIVPGWRESFYDKRIRDDNPVWAPARRLTRKNIAIAGAVMDYIPYAYVIDSGTLEPSMVPMHFIREGQKAIVVSNDPLAPFLCLARGDADVTVVTAKNVNSKVIRWGGILRGMSDAKSMEESVKDMSDNLAPWALAMAGCKKHDVPQAKKGYGIAKAAKALKDWSANGLITDAWSGDLSVVEPGARADGWGDDEVVSLWANYHVINPTKHWNEVTDADRAMMTAQVKDGSDVRSLKAVNEQYYEGTYLSLDYLFEGVDS